MPGQPVARLGSPVSKREIDPIERSHDMTRQPHRARAEPRLPASPRRVLGLVIIGLCLAPAGIVWHRTGRVGAGVVVFACLALFRVFLLLIRDPADK